MNTKEIREIFNKQKLYCGRMISGSKQAPKDQVCVWNANIITKSGGKVWFGDLNLTKEGEKLKVIGKEIGETLFVLKECDARFGTEDDSIEVLISRAAWDTTK